MAREYNYAISQFGKAVFIDLVNSKSIKANETITDVELDKTGNLSCLIDGHKQKVKVKVKKAYNFMVLGHGKTGTGWPLQSANDARDSGEDFYIVFIDYQNKTISGGMFLDIIEPRHFDGIEWPYNYNAAGQQIELYSVHLMDTIGKLTTRQQENLVSMSILNKKIDKNQVDLF